jgi:hypothetical protein
MFHRGPTRWKARVPHPRHLPHVHWYNRYWGADYDGRHFYQCRCGDLSEGI